MKSEFPETRLNIIGKKFGWIFSPLLLVSLIIFTLFIAEGLKLDLESKSIERKGSIELKDIKNATAFSDNKEIGKTPLVFDTTSVNQVEITVKKDGRDDWKKTVKPRPGFVKTYYPILYPKDLDFKDDSFVTDEVFKVNNANFFFYKKNEDSKTVIYKYSITKQIFGSRVQNVPFADITTFVALNKKFTIIPGNTGKSFLLVVYGERTVSIDDKGVITDLRNVIPKAEDTFSWSPNDTYILYKSGDDLYSLNPSNGRVILLYRPANAEEKLDIEFLLDSSFLYKIHNASFSDLMQNSYEGNAVQKIELPNIDNIRKNNLVRAYDMLERENLILIQTKENIFTYNVITFELKKFNLYKYEKIVYIDPVNEHIVTTNEKNKNQFIFTDMLQDERKVFTLGGTDDKEEIQSVTGYNGSQNLVMQYPNKIELVDIDGANPVAMKSFKTPEIILALRQDNVITYVVKDLNPAALQSSPLPGSNTAKFTLNIERFEN